MKGLLSRTMTRAILIFVAVILVVNYKARIYLAHEELEKTSADFFWQIDQLADQSQLDVREAENEFSETCLGHARAVAYIAQYRPEVVEDIEETKKLAELLDVDEIHFFNTDGEIYAGTHPEYYHFTFDSGEQMKFFSPMLSDTKMELCQGIEANTAENKMMQYAAVWREDKKGIVQIGMKPERVVEITKQKSLSSTLSVIPTERSIALYVIDPESKEILASTDMDMTGANAEEKGFSFENLEPDQVTLTHVYFDGAKKCLAMGQSGDYIYARTYPSHFVIQETLVDTGFLMIYIFILFLVALFSILHYMDSRLIRGLKRINQGLCEIGEGNLDNMEDNTGIPELSEVIHYINQMLQSVRGSYQKFSVAIEKSQFPIGVWEYNGFYHRSFVNSRIWDILGIPKEDGELSACSSGAIEQKILEIKKNPMDGDKDVYRLKEETGNRYIHMEEFDYDQSHVVLLTDVTEEWKEKELLKQQRDMDTLTNLYNRRGFSERLDLLFEKKEELGYAAVIMIDADGLKKVNDVWGHLVGDLYLNKTAQIMTLVAGRHSVCARLGGDEFVMFLYGYGSIQELENGIKALETENDRHVINAEGGEKIVLRFSMGYAVYPSDAEDYHVLMRQADEKMYQRKRERGSERTE